jgi:hypothetical protein
MEVEYAAGGLRTTITLLISVIADRKPSLA